VNLVWTEKFKNQINSIFEGRLEKGVWIAGGSVRGLVFNEEYGDIDIFFDSEETYEEVKVILEGKGAVKIRQKEYLDEYEYGGAKIQLSRYEYFPTLQSVLDGFDFTITRFGCDTQLNTLFNQSDFRDVVDKTLRPAVFANPIIVFMRILKFKKKGYTPCEGFWEELIKQLRCIDDPIGSRYLARKR
jgi:hypothetical protein